MCFFNGFLGVKVLIVYFGSEFLEDGEKSIVLGVWEFEWVLIFYWEVI